MDKEKKQRTKAQNRAFHKYFTDLADELNEKGLDMKKVLKPEIDITWTSSSVKEYLWRATQKIMFNKESTTELNTDEITKIYEVINRFTAGQGVSVAFPSIEEIMLRDLTKEKVEEIPMFKGTDEALSKLTSKS